MKRVISKRRLVLLFSYVIFIAHTLAEPPDAVKNEFIAHRRRQEEARISARTNPNLQSPTVLRLKTDQSLKSEHLITTNWAGAIHLSPPSGTFSVVVAEWTLPTDSRPPSSNGSGIWYSSEWIGVDGFSCTGCSSPCTTGGFFQAGTFSYVQVSSSGAVTTGAEAFYEWFPNGAVIFSNFSVVPGDPVAAFFIATSSSQVVVSVINVRTRKSGGATVSAPDPSSNLCGNTAEWILEDFTGSAGLLPLSDFTNVSFQSCVASTSTAKTVNLTTATLIDMVQNDVVLATAAVVNATELQIYYG